MSAFRSIHPRRRRSTPITIVATSVTLALSGVASAVATVPDGATVPPDAPLASQADGHVQIVRADGSDQKVVTSATPDGQAHPDWSPDGDQLVFETQFAELWTVGVDGSEPTSVFRCERPCASIQDGAWSPDASEIAFMVTETADGTTTLRSAIVALDVASGEVRTIYEDTSGVVWLFHPRWSGDGEAIVFEADTFASNLLSESEITSMAVTTVPTAGGATATRLIAFDSPADGPGAPAPDWSPIGDRIVFVRGDNLFTIGADGADERQITEFDGVREHAIQPTFTPDGSAIVFTYVTGEFGVDDAPTASVIALDGSGQTAIGGDRRMTHVRLQP